MTRRKNWSIHICAPWSGDCAMRGIRININTPKRFVTIGLLGGEVMRKDGKWVKFEVEPR